MHPAVIGLLVVAAGCARGGGPFVGYSSRSGLVYGGELSGGLAYAHTAIGMQNVDRFRYARVDLYANAASYSDARHGLGARVGAGYGLGTAHSGATFAIGPNVGYRVAGEINCSVGTHAVVLGVELRYAAGEAQIVAMSRYDRISGCAGK